MANPTDTTLKGQAILNRVFDPVNNAIDVNATVSATVDTTGLASDTNQTNGSQKTQIVDSGGEAVTVTGGKLDVNATASLAGESLPVSGATSGVAVAIVDGSGNQVTSFGGGTQYTEGDTDASITGTAILHEVAANTLATISSANPLPISDNGGAITVDGTVAVTNAGITTIAGAVAGTEMQVDVLTMPTTTVQATNLDIRDLTSASDSVEVKQATGTNLHVVVDTAPTTAVTGTFWQATQPVSGTVTANLSATDNTVLDNIDADTSAIQTSVELLDDTVATDGAATPTKGILMAGQDGTNAQTIKTDTSGELQVDVLTMPTVAVTQSGTWDEVGINDSGNSITVDGTVGVTNGGTFVTQENGALLTSAQLIDDVVYTDDTSTHSTGSSKGVGIMATAAPTDTSVNANDIGMLAMTTDRRLLVDASGVAVPITDNSGSLTVDYATTGSGNATGALRVELANNGTGVIATVGAVTAITNALPAGTNAIGKLAANSGIDIGDVDITSIVPGTGATNLGKAEDATHTSADVGVMALGVRTDVPNAVGAGTTGEYSFLATDMAGGIRTALYETDFAVLGTKHVKKYYTNAGAVTDGIIWSPAAGARWYVTDIFINVSAAATVTLEDDLSGGDSALWKAELAANSGWSHHFGTPLFSGEDAADLIITTSAANVYVTVTGYEI